MQSWKDVPHLFANRQFYAVHKDDDSPDLIIGCEQFNNDSNLILDNLGATVARDCQLIARPIESMAREELSEIFEDANDKNVYLPAYIDLIKRMANNNSMNRDTFIYLLSVGVYPFDQSHFGDSVINAK